MSATFLFERDAVVLVGQALAEADQVHRPLAVLDGLLVGLAEARRAHREVERAAALEAVAAQEVLVLLAVHRCCGSGSRTCRPAGGRRSGSACPACRGTRRWRRPRPTCGPSGSGRATPLELARPPRGAELNRMRVDSSACAHSTTVLARTSRVSRVIAIDVGDAARLVGRLVHQHLVDHRVRDVRALAGLERVGDGGEGGVEVRVRDAAALARAAVVAGLRGR